MRTTSAQKPKNAFRVVAPARTTGVEKTVGYIISAVPKARTKMTVNASSHNCHSRRSRFIGSTRSNICTGSSLLCFSPGARAHLLSGHRNPKSQSLALQDFAHFARQGARREGLLDKGRPLLEQSVAHNGIVRIPRHVHHFHFRSLGSQAPGQLSPA